MPKPARFQNERTRAAALAVVMGLVFAASLGAAAALSHGYGRPKATTFTFAPRAVGLMQFDLPDNWRVARPSSAHDHFEQVIELIDRRESARRLLVGIVRLDEPAAPESLLTVADRLLIAEAGIRMDRRGSLVRFSSGPLRGAFTVGLFNIPADPSEAYLGVISLDGLTYWVIRLVAPIDLTLTGGQVDLNGNEPNRSLFTRVWRSAKPLIEAPAPPTDPEPAEDD